MFKKTLSIAFLFSLLKILPIQAMNPIILADNADGLRKTIKETTFNRNKYEERLSAIENFLKLEHQFTTEDIALVLSAFHLMQDKAEPARMQRLEAVIADIALRFSAIMNLQSLNEAAAFYIRIWEKDHTQIQALGKSIALQEKWVELADKSWPKHTESENDDDDGYSCPCCDLSEWLASTATYYLSYALAANDHERLKKTKILYDRVVSTKGQNIRDCHAKNVALCDRLLKEKEEKPDLTLADIANSFSTSIQDTSIPICGTIIFGTEVKFD